MELKEVRARVATKLQMYRYQIRDLEAKVRSLSESAIAIELHWMRPELEAYAQLRAKIPQIQAEMKRREDAVVSARAEIHETVQRAAEDLSKRVRRENQALRKQVKDLNIKLSQQRAELQEQMTRRELAIDEHLPVDWRSAYKPLPPKSDPIYSIRPC